MPIPPPTHRAARGRRLLPRATRCARCTRMRAPLALYIRKADKVIAVTFGAPREDLPKYEKLFRKSIQTIQIP